MIGARCALLYVVYHESSLLRRLNMKFTVVTYGTEGDTRPLAALCRALMNAGHETRLLADGATLSSAITMGVPASALSGDIKKALMLGEARSSAVRREGGFNSTAKALANIANTHTAAWMREVVDATEGCDAIIVSGLAAFVGLSVAEYRGIKAIGAGFIPITPTADFPSPFLPPGWVPRWFNRGSHRLVNGLLWRAFRNTTNAARADVCGLPPRRYVWTDHPMLYGVSPTLLPRPSDWPDTAYACGQWSVTNSEWMPPVELEEFLAAGAPPIYIGFGSMAGFDRHRLMQALAAAVTGRRVLFYPGWSGVDTSELPKDFFVIGETPHDWLFPRTSLVIHHGGAGTTHSAVRAGVPSVVVPFAGDQFFWADRLKKLGIAGEPVMGKRTRSSEIARCMEFAERDDVRTRASQLGARMAAENGLRSAVNAIERLMAGSA
jgi:sterol 3beta-glucosyltransferase